MPPQTKPGTGTQTPTAAASIRNNASAAAQAGGAGDPKCDFCDRVGLPILPLRYAVVPSYLPGQVQPPTYLAQLGKHLQGKPPEGLKGHRYALRVLRQGYVMVYLGSGVWHAYVVSNSGHLRKLADVDDPDFKNDREISAQCKTAGHNIPASFINIPALTAGRTRQLPSKVWLAFSDVLWTASVRKQYEGGAGAAQRAKRMQEFATDALGKQADTVLDAFQLPKEEATTVNRLSYLVTEYADSEEHSRRRTEYDAIDPYDAKKRNHIKWEGAHGVSMRTGEAVATAKRVAQLTPSNKDQLMASAVVLHDPLGMVQELNATRLGVIESRQRYLSDERIARPLLISQSIVGLKQIIGEQNLSRLKVQEEKQGIPDVQTHTITDLEGYSYGTYTDTRAERAASDTTRLWDSLQKHYREADRLAFETTVATTVKSFQDWLVKTDADYAHWLAQPDWVLRRGDFDSNDPEQQDRLIEAFGAALLGGPSNDPTNGPVGGAPVDTQVYEVWKDLLAKNPTDETNPIYVALFGQQKDFLDYLLPDGLNPAQDKIDKGSKLYKAIKNIVGTKEWRSDTLSGMKRDGMKGVLTREAESKVPNPVRAIGARAIDKVRGSWVPKAAGAVAHTLFALGGALNRMAVGVISELYQATALRAIQGAVLLYERREIYLATAQIKLREYLAHLNDIAFGAMDSMLGAAAKGIRRVAQAGKNTVRSMAVAGVLYISDKKVKDGLVNVLTWAYDDLDGVTRSMDAVASERQAARGAHEAAQLAEVAESAAMAAAMRVHPFTLSPGAEAFVQAVNTQARTLRMGGANILKAITRSSLRLASTGSGILAVGSFVVQGWSLKDNIRKAEASFLGSNEARVLVVAGSVAATGAFVELVGVSGKLAGLAWATKVGRIGGAIGAAASIVEGIQAFMAGQRAASHGDRDAKLLYRLAGAALIGGGVVGIYGAITGAAFLGPIGWALALIAIGVVLLFFAAKAEDSQAAIWLDRCYWGNGSRYENAGNPADQPWTNNQIDEELGQLNAIVIGLSAETGFNDDGWGFADWTWDTVKAKITFPNYSDVDSAYEWRLRAYNREKGRSVTLARGKLHELPTDPDAIVVTAKALKKKPDETEYFRKLVGPTLRLEGKNKDVLMVEVSVEVRVKYFQDVELTVDYVADLADPHGRASLALGERD
jgi:hypothetical protein